MPRKTEIPEYNKPESDYVIRTFGITELAKARKRLCAQCAVEGCRILPITTKGDDCPYFAPRPEGQK